MMMRVLAMLAVLLLAACSVGGAGRSSTREAFYGASVSEAFPDPQVRALVQAACAGNRARVTELVASGVDPNAPGMMLLGGGDILGYHPDDPLRAPVRPLSWMLVCHSATGVEALVAAGADPELRLYNHQSLIEQAIHSNDMRILQALIDAGADVNACGGVCPWRVAIELWQNTGSWRALDILLAHGLDIDKMAAERREDRFRNTTFTGFIGGRAMCKALSFAEQGPRRNEPMALFVVRSRLQDRRADQQACAIRLEALLTQRVGEEAYQAWLRDFVEARASWGRRD